MTFIRFWMECIPIFRTRSRKSTKTSISTNMVKLKNSDADQSVKSKNQLCREKKKAKIRAQSEIIEKQWKEIENLKAASAQVDPKSLMEVMPQAMAYMYTTNKGPAEKNVGTKPPEDKPYLGKKKSPQVNKGLDGSLDLTLTYHYCKDTGHKLENCCQLHHRIKKEQLATVGIIVVQSLNMKHP